ncbi:MAG: hypothetical protein Q4A52_06695 [Bacillota bacterium]|nr:hypothetical protein [Bacillota bacterium]
MTAKIGRPTDNPKTKSVRIRLTEGEEAKLKFCSEKLDKTKTEILVSGLDKVYQEIKKKE